MARFAAFPINLAGPLARIDARWKLAALVPAGACVGALQTPLPAAVALAGALLIVALADIPLRWYVTRIGAVVLFLIFFLIFLPLANHDEPERWQVGPLALSPRGLTLAVTLLLKAVALMSLVLAAATTAPIDVNLKALSALKMPGLLVQLLALTIRYLAVMLDEFARMRIALRVRGYRQRASPRSLRLVGHVAGMLLVRASDRGEHVAQAMRSRGFDGRFHALREFRTRPRDVVFFVIVIAAAAGFLVWDTR